MDPRTTQGEGEDSLAEHAGFLRTLARGLLFDRSAADDVAQKALLVALKRAPRGGAGAEASSGFSLKAWLVGVVKNLARERGREEQRRAQREQAAARPEALPSAAETAARLELMQRVVAAVRGLDEPYRTTVLLRFFDGLKPGAIAKRLGMPVETVRTRLKRALEQLRLELDARHGGDRAAWGLLLLPTALPGGGVLGVVGGSATLHALLIGGVEALAMSTKLKIGIGVAAATITAAVLWTAIGPAPVPERTAPRGTQASSSAPVAEVAAPAAVALEPAPTAVPTREEVTRETATPPPDPTLTFVIAGTTKLPDGQPHGGLHVKLSRFDGYEASGNPAASVELESDARGAFVWRQRPPPGTTKIVAQGLEKECAPLWSELLVLSGEEPGSFDLTFFPYDCTVVGKVTDERDAPLPDARVQSWEAGAPFECDETGEFTVRACSGHGQTYLSAWAPGRAEGRATVQLPGPGSRVEVNLRLRSGFVVRGRITDERGTPVSGASVTAASYASAKSDADGRYVLDSIDPVEPEAWLSVKCPGYVATSATVATAGGVAERDFVLQRGVRVEGAVVDAAGNPVRGAEVWIGEGRYRVDVQRALSHDDGSFSFAFVGSGDRKLGCEKKGMPGVEITVSVPEDRDTLSGVVLRIGESHSLAGKVVDRDGRPIADANVLYCRDQSSFDGYSKSDGEGRFRLEAMGAGPYTIRISRGGYLMKDEPSGRLDREDALFVLEKGGRLAGRVVDGDTDEPVKAFRIRFVDAKVEDGEQAGWGWEASWSDPGRSFVSDDGTWRCDGESIPVGSVIGVEVTAEGYAATLAPHVVAAADPAPGDCVLRLTLGARVTGIVLDEGRQPVGGALVRLGPSSTSRSPWRARNDDARWCVRTAGDGTFSIECAPAGECSLVVDAAEFAPMTDGPFDVPSRGSAPPRRIELKRGGSIDGVVLDADGEPQSGREVMRFDPRLSGTGAAPESATTDAEGRFRFTRLPRGVHQVTLLARRGSRGVNELTATVRVEGPEPQTVLLQPSGESTLRGRITGEGGPAELVVVTLQWLGPPGSAEQTEPPDVGLRSDRGLFAEDGTFEVAALDPGRYFVAASTWNETTRVSWFGTAEVVVLAGADAEVTVRIAPTH